MGNFTVAFVVCMLSALAMSEAAVYIGGGCYDCNPPGGQGPGIYTGNGAGTGGGRGGGGGGNYYNPGSGGGRAVYSGNFGPDSGTYTRRGGGGGAYGGGGGGGGRGYDDGFTQIISG